MSDFSSLASTIGMIAALLLIVGGIRLTMKRETRSRGILMVIAAAVIVMNVMIWTV